MQKPQLFLDNALFEDLTQFCRAKQYTHFLLIADDSTYAVLGCEVENHLVAAGWDVRSVILHDSQVLPNENNVVEVLLQSDAQERVLLAVGSGTLTDITRFVSYKLHQPFLSLPTAPSVDGFSSPVAALVIGGVKLTTPAQPPQAIFADPLRLAAAPRPMIAAGFGDLLGKATSLADWQLGRLLWDEKYDAQIAARVRKMFDGCIRSAEKIGQRDPASVAELMSALIDSGNCMLDFGSSQPASGSEHHLSHYLELKLLREGRPAILHGAKVGLNTLVIAGLYANLRDLSKTTAAELLQCSELPARSREEARITTAYPKIAKSILNSQTPFLEMTETDFDQLKQRILQHWEEIQVIAATVPSVDKLTGLLRSAGCAVRAEDLGLQPREVAEALHNAHYLRPRFTICKLMKVFYPNSY